MPTTIEHGLNSQAVLYNTASDSLCNIGSTFAIGGETDDLLFGEDQDIGKVIDEAVVQGSLSDLTENMRSETIVSVSKALDKGRKHVWELAARRVSALLSCDALCTTSPHHFLQSLDWVNKFVLAGEAFSGAEAISLRAKLVKLCEKYFTTFHRQNLEVMPHIFCGILENDIICTELCMLSYNVSIKLKELRIFEGSRAFMVPLEEFSYGPSDLTILCVTT